MGVWQDWHDATVRHAKTINAKYPQLRVNDSFLIVRQHGASARRVEIRHGAGFYILEDGIIILGINHFARGDFTVVGANDEGSKGLTGENLASVSETINRDAAISGVRIVLDTQQLAFAIEVHLTHLRRETPGKDQKSTLGE